MYAIRIYYVTAPDHVVKAGPLFEVALQGMQSRFVTNHQHGPIGLPLLALA